MLLEGRRIALYLTFAYGIAWSCGLIIARTGGLANSPPLRIPGTSITLALVLLATGYMGARFAHILTRLITREGWQDPYLRPRLRHGWPVARRLVSCRRC